MRRQVVAVIVPCFRVRSKILSVLAKIGPDVDMIVVVDDACPEQTGTYVIEACRDPRLHVVRLDQNRGVGGAVLTGYDHAMAEGADILVKLDGDGQMDPALIHLFVDPIRLGHADYTKGNRFFNIEDVKAMPLQRLVGNALLSFMTKASSGYWANFDPTNGFTAISAAVLRHLPRHKVSCRYFFESDLLFRLGTIRARVLDIPMAAVYGDEQSSLHIPRILGPFLLGNIVNFGKRLAYNYFLRDFTIASLQLALGIALLTFGVLFGTHAWMESVTSGITASTGTVMLAALPVILGMQLLLSFLAYDMAAMPDRALHPLLPDQKRDASADKLAHEIRDLVADLDQRRGAAA